MSLSQVEFVAFDLETTGLFPISCRIVEFGAVRFRLDGTELGCLEQLVDPGCEIPGEVVRIHGITSSTVRGKPSPEDFLPRFLEFLGPVSTPIFAHNAPFDLGFLAMALRRSGLPPPPHRVFDSICLAKACLKGFPRFSLEFLGQNLGVAASEQHRALADARLAAAVFAEIVRLRRLESLDEVLRLARPCCLGDMEELDCRPPSGYERMAEMIESRSVLAMLYQGGPRGASWLRTTPRGFVRSGGRSYLLAYCHWSRVEKTYRLDRIVEFRRTEEGTQE